ncbi:MAG: hypothetical protein JW727_01440 [Candidatus Aenigmarchaeota archaeon]|nr:hypothetical protein [Candidatus Aenigmarchaeota archaeon]
MNELKGAYPPLLILFGLVVSVVIFMAVFKVLGQAGAFQYEQQAEITARNMQTAINQVCVTGATQEVSVNFPQRLSSSGISKHPLSLMGSIASGDFAATSDALRYMAALDSFGDPWYVLYYEDFPVGEDSGWTGWSSVAAERTTSQAMKFSDAAICLSTSAVPVLGDMKNLGARIARKAGSVDDMTEIYQKNRALDRLLRDYDSIYITARVAGGTVRETVEKTWLVRNGRNVLSKGKGAYDQSLGKVFNRFFPKKALSVAVDPPMVSPVGRHLTAFSKTEEIISDSSTGINSLKSVLAREGGDTSAANRLIKQLDGLKTNKELTEGGYKNIVSQLKNSDDAKQLYSASSDILAKDIEKHTQILGSGSNPLVNRRILGPDGNTLSDAEEEFLGGLVRRVGAGDEISKADVRVVKRIFTDSKGEIDGEWQNFVEVFQDTQAINENFRQMESLSRHLLDDNKLPTTEVDIRGTTIKAGPQPIEYSRVYLDAIETRRFGLPAIAAYSSVMGVERLGQIAKSGLIREGRWATTSYGASFMFNTLEVSLFDQAQYKFYPCSGNALCLKSAVNPSISILPLDDCKAVGIDYIELDKTPADAALISGSSSSWSIATLNSFGTKLFGGKTTSKFYTASPCSGKVKIERTACDCIMQEQYYIDTSSPDIFEVKCTIEDFIGDEVRLKCTLTKKRSYASFSGEAEVLDENLRVLVPLICKDDLGRCDLSFDLTDSGMVTFSVGRWDDYFGEYYADLSEKTRDRINQIKDTKGDQWPSGDGTREDELSKVDKLMDTLGEWDFVLPLEASIVNNLDEAKGKEISFDPIVLPSVPFKYHTCIDESQLWLKCAHWENIGASNLVKDTLDGKENIKANEWCCLSWVLSKEDGSSSPIQGEVLHFDSCEEYSTLTFPLVRNNLGSVMGLDFAPIGGEIYIEPEVEGTFRGGTSRAFRAYGEDGNEVTSGLVWSEGTAGVCQRTSTNDIGTYLATGEGACRIDVQYGGKKAFYIVSTVDSIEWGFDTEAKANLFLDSNAHRIQNQLSQSGKIILPKKSDGGQDIDPNGEIGKLYWYNLPLVFEQGEKTPCIKIKYYATDEMGAGNAATGFCYSSPTAWADVKAGGWVLAATVIDMGLEVAIDITTAGSGAASGIGGFVSCMAGNFIMWYGEQAVSEEKQEGYWPNNIYFENYFTD